MSPLLAMFDIGGGEFFMIVFVALLLFGGRLPEIARTAGRIVGELKRNAENLTRDFRDEMNRADPPPPRKPRPPLSPPKEEKPRTLAQPPKTEPAATSESPPPPPEPSAPKSDDQDGGAPGSGSL